MTRFDPFDFSARLDNGVGTLSGVGTPGGDDALSGVHVNGQATTPPKAADAAGGKPEAHGSGGRRKRKAGGSPGGWWVFLCSFVGHDLRDVSPSAGVVWLVLFTESRNGITRQLSQQQIGKMVNLSDRHVRRAIDELIAAGLVNRVARGGRNSGPTIYKVFSTGRRCPVDGDSQQDTGVRLSQDTGVRHSHKRDANGDAERVAFARSDDAESSDPNGGTGR